MGQYSHGPFGPVLKEAAMALQATEKLYKLFYLLLVQRRHGNICLRVRIKNVEFSKSSDLFSFFKADITQDWFSFNAYYSLHSGIFTDNQTCLVCIARRVPMIEKVNTMVNNEAYTTKCDLTGKILDFEAR